MRISKYICMVVLGISCLFMFTGCSNKTYAINQIGGEYAAKGETPGRLMYVQGREAWRSPSGGYNVKTRNIHLLQNSADLTLNEGFKYFAIGLPHEMSNMNGQTMNTAEEFIEKCTPSEAQIFDVGNGRCGLEGSIQWVGIVIATYKERPLEYMTYDAQEVRDYLISHDLYRKDETYTLAKNTTGFQKTYPDVGILFKSTK